MNHSTGYRVAAFAAVTLLTGCNAMDHPSSHAEPDIHYVEIVTPDTDAHRQALERHQGLTFGPADADLGQARVAETPDGSLIGVRAPLAEHEAPVVRTYLEVDDIEQAVADAEAAGALIAYPPTVQGDTGTWAIYILGDVQIGLWQR